MYIIQNKKWFWIAVSALLVPEIFWSPVFNYGYIFFHDPASMGVRENFIMQGEAWPVGFFIIAVQLAGLIGIWVFAKKSQMSKSKKVLLLFLLSSLVVALSIMLLIIFGLRNGVNFLM